MHLTSDATPLPLPSSARIISTPGVCGGDPTIAGTRIPVWVLEQARRVSKSIEDLLEDYPGLKKDDILLAWKFAEEHKSEIDAQILEIRK